MNYILFFLSKPFSSVIIRVSSKCHDVCRQCVEVSTNVSIYLAISSHVQTMFRYVHIYTMSRSVYTMTTHLFMCLDMSIQYLNNV